MTMNGNGFLADANQEAINQRNAQWRKPKAALMVAVLSGFVALIAGYNALVDFTPGKMIVTVIGAAVAVGGGMLTRQLLRQMRFRVYRPNAGMVGAAKFGSVIGGLIVISMIASALDVPPNPTVSTILVGVTIALLVFLRQRHDQQWVLFEMDSIGVRVGRETLPWREVEQVVLVPAGQPGTTELGVLAVGTAAPVSVETPDAQLDRDLLAAAVDRFGPPRITLAPLA